MFKITPCRGSAPILLLVLLACDAYSQSPPYTIPSDPAGDRRIKTAAANVPPRPITDQSLSDPLPADWFLVHSPVSENSIGAESKISEQSIGADSISVEPVSAQSIVESVGVEPFAVEPAGVCDCKRSGRDRSDCPLCRNHWGLFPKMGSQGSIGGWLQQGFTGNFASPHDRSNAPVLFNDRSNDYRLNQLYLYSENVVQPNRNHWDFGGRVDVLLGSDARFVTVPGLEQHKDRTPKWNSETDDYGIAIPQAYVEVAAPWSGNSTLKAGHFYSVAGYETVAAPENFFYSHSYTFLYGEPFTLTGALFTTQPNDRVKLQAGYTTGWDVFDSSSDEYGILAGITLTSADEQTSFAATVISGKDITSVSAGGALVDENRNFYSLVLQHQINKHWRYVFQHDLGYQEDGKVVVNTGPSTITLDSSMWYGINQYLIHDINKDLSSALRVEWFRDDGNSRLGVPVVFNPGGPTFEGGNYVEVTGGFNWRPHRNVTIRPELRWDYSDVKGNGNAPGGDPGFRVYDDNTSSSQGTAAVDVILLY